MAKRNTGVGSKNKNKKSPHKTQKRRELKREKLAQIAAKRHK